MALTPPPAAPQRGDRATFAQRVDAFITWLINFVSELVGLVANLNSIAAGGAYAIPYVLRGLTNAVGGPAGGMLAFNVNGTGLAIDTKDAVGANVAALLSSAASSTSAVKATLRIVKQGDPSIWLVYSLGAYYPDSGGLYGYFDTNFIAGSAGNAFPFADGDAVMLHFQRTGDKGDTGPMQTLRTMLVRDQRGAGVAAQSLAGGTWNTRVLNTVVWNEIAGASLAGNIITLPVGTYWVDADAPILGGGSHVARIFDVTNNTLYDVGKPERAFYGEVTSRSSIRTILNVTSGQIQIRIDHYLATGGTTGGTPAGIVGEVYTEVKITKVA